MSISLKLQLQQLPALLLVLLVVLLLPLLLLPLLLFLLLLLAAWLLLLLALPAGAWNSKCFVDDEHRTCDTGFEAVRHRWTRPRQPGVL